MEFVNNSEVPNMSVTPDIKLQEELVRQAVWEDYHRSERQLALLDVAKMLR